MERRVTNTPAYALVTIVLTRAGHWADELAHSVWMLRNGI
jgi:hypothetical protein